tara:strand:- start:236 stop:391 length:156 start_codon:yes stop_codon:yes gene_type:complete
MSSPNPGKSINVAARAIYEPVFTGAPPLAMFKQLFDTGCLFSSAHKQGDNP